MLVTACDTSATLGAALLVGTDLSNQAADTFQVHRHTYLIGEDSLVLERVLLNGKVRII
ncbi:MAG: hypothetical protein ACI9RO_002409 [Alteromonas macleodii]|jgi:hypothetical protein